MKKAFDANVSRRRPKTKRRSAVSALTGATAAPGEDGAQGAEPDGVATPTAEQQQAAQCLKAHMKERKKKKTRAAGPSACAERAEQVSAAIAEVERPRPSDESVDTAGRAETLTPPGATEAGLATGAEAAQAEPAAEPAQARIDQLKRRLAASGPAAAFADVAQPWDTTEATKRVVEAFRARVRQLTEEREELSQALSATRTELGALQRRHESAAQALERAESLAEERGRLGQELMAEVELLATERDQALTRVAEWKAIEQRRSQRLSEVETALAEKEQEQAALRARLAELDTELEARDSEIENLNSQLSRRISERDALLERIVELEAEARTAVESREALAEIQRMVSTTKI